MSENQKNEEIDLGQVLSKIGDKFNRLQGRLYDLILLVFKFKFLVLSLLVVGFVVGYILDGKSVDLKRTEVVVIPNYDSSDFLYRNIENISSLLSKEREEELLQIFGTQHTLIKGIEINPIYDLRLLIRSTELMDILKESVKDNRLGWIQEEFEKGRIQKYHSIEIITDEEANAVEIANNLVSFLNSNEFYKQIRLISLENVNFQLEEFDRTLVQIDSVISATTSKKISSIPSSQGFFLNDNSHISSLIEYKSVILEEKFEKLRRYEQKDDVIHLVSVDTNTELKVGRLTSNLKLILPTLLFFSFIGIILLVSYVKYISQFSRLKNKE